MQILGALGATLMGTLRLWPYAAAMLATLWACFVWMFLTILPSGMLLLALVVGTFAIATWVTAPITLTHGLFQTRERSFWPWAPLVLVAAAAVACVYANARLSGLNTGPSLHFDLLPSQLFPGFVFGFIAAGTAYPYLKLEMVPEKATLVGVVVGFATYTLWENLWITLPVTVAVRWGYLAWIFYASKQLARASCPATTARLY